MESSTKMQWIQQYQAGDKTVFSKIYESYYKKVYYTALKISRNQADAKDIAQETFLQVEKSLMGLKDVELFDQWLNRIIISKASDLFRKNKTTSFPEEHPLFQVTKEERGYMLPESQLHFDCDHTMLAYFLDQLDEKYRVVLVLSYFDNMKIKDIAMILDIPEGTVKSRMSTGREQLKEMILKYQEKEGILLNFRTADIATMLTAFFAQDFAQLAVIVPPIPHIPTINFFQNALFSNLATTSLCAALVGTCVYASYQAYNIYDKQKQIDRQNLKVNYTQTEEVFGPILYQNKTFDNPEDAFYELTLWAHCDKEMKAKTEDEIQAIKPLYEELKKQQGVYWKLMEFRGWNEQFERNE